MSDPQQEQKPQPEPEPPELAKESFDYRLRVLRMPIEKLAELEEQGHIKARCDYEG